MSIPTKDEASSFLAPLKGSLAVLLLHDTEAKVKLGRFVLRCASLQSIDAVILDSDAFYAANMERFAEDAQSMSKDAQSMSKDEVLLLPERRFKVKSLVPLLSSRRRILVIDDLNSLYSLTTDGSESQQLTILMKLLSHNARMNGSWAIATAYRAEVDPKQSAMNQRSLTSLGDLLIDTDSHGDSIKFKSSVKSHWTNGEFSL